MSFLWIALAVVVVAALAAAVFVIPRRRSGPPALPPPAAPLPGVEDEPAATTAAESEAPAPTLETPEPAAGRLHRLRARLARSQSTLGRGLLSVLARDDLDEAA